MQADQHPVIVLVLHDTDMERWQEVLNVKYDVQLAGSVAALESVSSRVEPDVCVVDIGLTDPSGGPLVVAARGCLPTAEFVGVSAEPNIDRLVTSINDGEMRRFLAPDAPADEILDRIGRVYRQSASVARLQSRLSRLRDEHERLLNQHSTLLDQIDASERHLDETESSHRAIRTAVEGLLDLTLGLSNCLSLESMKVRLSEEIEKHKRHSLPVSMLVMDMDYGASSRSLDETRRRVHQVVADCVRHIDLITSDSDNRLIVLMPVTNREQASIACARIASALGAPGAGAQPTAPRIWSYPDDRKELEGML